MAIWKDASVKKNLQGFWDSERTLDIRPLTKGDDVKTAKLSEHHMIYKFEAEYSVGDGAA